VIAMVGTRKGVEIRGAEGDPCTQIGAGGTQVDILDRGHAAATLDACSHSLVIVVAAPRKQRPMPGIGLDRSETAFGVDQRHIDNARART
jgi:hypothetical protein